MYQHTCHASQRSATWRVFSFIAMKYNKPYLSVENQKDLLLARRLIVDDADLLYETLNSISYYRLSAYIYPFRINGDPDQNLLPATTFDTVFKLYSFDRKLRLLIFDAIERIEIAFRARLTLALSKEKGNNWYHDENHFEDMDKFYKSISIFRNEYKKSKEVFIKHFQEKYNESQFPPSWIALEICSLGQISSLFTNLKNKNDKQKVADFFELKYPVLESWLHSISYIRNICAHHSRIWNRSLGIRPVFPAKKHFNWLKNKNVYNNRIYYFLVVLKYLLNIVHPKNSFGNKLLALLNEYKSLDLSPMNFPENWTEEKLWKID